jgi:hypothetical protein
MGKLIWGWGVVYGVGVAIYGLYLLKKYVLSRK